MSDHDKQLPTADEYTNDWYRQQFLRLNWQVTQITTVLVDQLEKATHTATALRKEVNELRQARERDSAKLGELQERIDGHEKRLDKASEFLRTLRKKGETE
jgi:chromosome segregation ATPase